MDMWQRADVWSRLIGDFFTLKLKIDCFLPGISIPRFRTGQEREKWSTEEKVGYLRLSLTAGQLKLILTAWKSPCQRQKGLHH